jgi:hypothetical protein
MLGSLSRAGKQGRSAYTRVFRLTFHPGITAVVLVLIYLLTSIFRG